MQQQGTVTWAGDDNTDELRTIQHRINSTANRIQQRRYELGGMLIPPVPDITLGNLEADLASLWERKRAVIAAQDHPVQQAARPTAPRVPRCTVPGCRRQMDRRLGGRPLCQAHYKEMDQGRRSDVAERQQFSPDEDELIRDLSRQGLEPAAIGRRVGKPGWLVKRRLALIASFANSRGDRGKILYPFDDPDRVTATGGAS